ncbi:Na+/H+ antiporter-like protein [Tieghemostelium lacteum]|uniref:Na+/H+ antiporter-like protein n=1 Tax=Tieghemostelium lacteum TaxID=361077 RepID=A0A151ZK82_TIELA|nr:Na+/H+ antiporter-like protein [Tieghemostelium lacteum]|eukprot:KYQ94224.1 Na+/H+ antiporter-like protein [Tieghemostelium lacteum]
MVSSHPLESDVGLFLIQCVLIIIVSRVVTWLFAKIQQPPVIAEIISGILLGPTAFGKIPGFSSHLFTAASTRILYVFAQVGLIFFMFIIGLELDPTLFKSQIRKSAIISFVSIVFPFGLGVAASVYLADIQGTEWSYSLGIFIGVALCITAFPVLARILTSKKLLSTPIGILSIACAAINDICGWILLGLSVSLAGGAGSLDTLWTLLASAGFCAVMILVVKPILNRVVSKIWVVDPTTNHLPSPSHVVMSATILLLFIASWCTEYIGIHAMFGSFVLGAITPKHGAFNQAITEKIEDLVLVFLLPLYFVISGLKTDLTTLNDGKSWLGVLLIISCACFGKIVGAGLTSKFLGYSIRDSFSIGVLMNTRGLVELIVLNLGLDFGIIHTQVFGIMVLMAVFTTILTSPIISLVMRQDRRQKPYDSDQLNVVFCTTSFNMASSLVDLGYAMVGSKNNNTPTHQLSILNRKKLKKIYVLGISEVNDRPSDFIGQIRKNISKSSYSHLVSQGNQMKLKVSISQIVSDNEHLSKEVIQFTDQKASSMLVISEFPQGKAIGADITYQMIKNSISHVSVFTDKSGIRGNFNRFKRVLAVYLGGKNENDETTLNLLVKMAETDGISITIIVFDNESYWKHKKSLTLTQSMKKQEDLSGSNSNNNNNNNNLNSSNEKEKNLLSPEGVPINETVEIYDSKEQESHLEKVLCEKNCKSIDVMYKPKKAKIKVLMEQCPNYDLLVVPYETTKVVQSSPFASFNVPDLMRKSLSMVHLPGHKKSHSIPMENITEFDDHPNLKKSTAKLGSSNHLEKIESGSNPTPQDLEHVSNPLNSSNGIQMNTERELSNSSNSSDNESDNRHEDPRPYWIKCPISSLVVYHKNSIPVQSDIEDSLHKTSSIQNVDQSTPSSDNLEPYEVDPSVLSTGSVNNIPQNNNIDNSSNNNNDHIVEIPREKAE